MTALAASSLCFAGSLREENFERHDMSSNQELHHFAGHRGPVTGVALSHYGHSATCASYEQTQRPWRLLHGQELHRSAAE